MFSSFPGIKFQRRTRDGKRETANQHWQRTLAWMQEADPAEAEMWKQTVAEVQARRHHGLEDKRLRHNDGTTSEGSQSAQVAQLMWANWLATQERVAPQLSAPGAKEIMINRMMARGRKEGRRREGKDGREKGGRGKERR